MQSIVSKICAIITIIIIVTEIELVMNNFRYYDLKRLVEYIYTLIFCITIVIYECGLISMTRNILIFKKYPISKVIFYGL